MRNITQKSIASLLILMMISFTIQMPLAHAAMVKTDQMLLSQKSVQDREKVAAFLDRSDVTKELQHYGVSAEDAKMRVAALSDHEVKKLSGQIDNLPAGGLVGTLVGAALFIFVVLLVTDILGFTDVYPFVHSHGH